MAESSANDAKNENSITIGEKIRQAFRSVNKLFTKNPSESQSSDSSSKKKKKFGSFKKIHKHKGTQVDDSKEKVDLVQREEILIMPVIEESSGAKPLVHVQKDRPKPARNHKDRLTIVPQNFVVDAQFDKFFGSNDSLLDGNVKDHVEDTKYIKKPPIHSSDKSQEIILSEASSQNLMKSALLPPSKPVIVNKPSATPQQLKAASLEALEPTVEYAVPNKVPTTSPNRTRTISQTVTSKSTEMQIGLTSKSSTEPSKSTKIPSYPVRARPISEVFVPSSLPKTENLFTAISENSIRRAVSFKKSDPVYLASTSQSVEPRPRSISEVGSIQEKEIAAVISSKATSLDEKTASKSDMTEEQTQAVLRLKKTDSTPNSSEQRKSVLEMTKLFESSKQHIHSSTSSLHKDENKIVSIL